MPELFTDCALVQPEIVDDGVDDYAVEVQNPRVARASRAPTAEEVEAHIASGHACHRSWCDACMRARGVAGRHEQRKDHRPDEDPVIGLDYCYMTRATTRTSRTPRRCRINS